MYQRVVQRLQTGENYYDALGSELRNGKYPSKSVFNWRSPFHLMALAVMTEPVSRYMLAAFALAASILAGMATNRGGGPGAVQILVTMVALSECFIFDRGLHLYVFAEVWAGVFITISVAAYALDWWPAGVSAGIMALFLRELALPYVVVSWLIALRKRSRREFYAWTAGLLGWTVYFLIHSQFAMSHMREGDIALHAGPAQFLGWVRFGGPRFLVETVRMSLLHTLPPWVAAATLTIMLFGAAGWTTGIGQRVAAVVAVYMAAFSIVGLPVDQAWGALTNPVLAFGLVWFVPAMRDLIGALFRSRGPLAPSVSGHRPGPG